MFLEKLNYSKNALFKKTVLITGGGGGIGYEASRAFSYIGANVIVAEIDTAKGIDAQTQINDEGHAGIVDFYQIDISDEKHRRDHCFYTICGCHTIHGGIRDFQIRTGRVMQYSIRRNIRD